MRGSLPSPRHVLSTAWAAVPQKIVNAGPSGPQAAATLLQACAASTPASLLAQLALREAHPLGGRADRAPCRRRARRRGRHYASWERGLDASALLAPGRPHDVPLARRPGQCSNPPWVPGAAYRCKLDVGPSHRWSRYARVDRCMANKRETRRAQVPPPIHACARTSGQVDAAGDMDSSVPSARLTALPPAGASLRDSGAPPRARRWGGIRATDTVAADAPGPLPDGSPAAALGTLRPPHRGGSSVR